MLANFQQTFLERAHRVPPAWPTRLRLRVPGALPGAPERARGAARPAGPVLGGRRGVRRARRRAHGRRRPTRPLAPPRSCAPAPIDAPLILSSARVAQTDGVLRTRREMLALMGGVGAAVVIGGCGDGGSSSATGTTRRRPARRPDRRPPRLAPRRRRPRRPPRLRRAPSTGSRKRRGSLPGRRVERPERAGAERRGARRHPLELRGLLGTVAAGVPLTIDLTLVDVDGGGVPLEGAAVYLWHCDIDGALLDVLAGRRGRELPARRAGGRSQRHGHVHEHLPGCVLGSLAAHPLPGLPRRRGRDRRRQPSS